MHFTHSLGLLLEEIDKFSFDKAHRGGGAVGGCFQPLLSESLVSPTLPPPHTHTHFQSVSFQSSPCEKVIVRDDGSLLCTCEIISTSTKKSSVDMHEICRSANKKKKKFIFMSSSFFRLSSSCFFRQCEHL